MRRLLRDHRGDVAAVLGLVLVALAVAGYVTTNQRMTLPSWVPLAGDDRVVLRAVLEDGKSLVPGQGQAVTVAGVEVGEVTGVDLERGRARVTMALDPDRATLHRDATAVVRPRTGLEDMVVELGVGTPRAGRLPEGATLPLSQTTSGVQVDRVLAMLDADTRARLLALVGAGGRALEGDGARSASATLRRFEPLARDVRAIATALARRRAAVAGVVTRLGRLASTVGERDDDLTTLVSASDEVLAGLARQDRALRASLDALPGALRRSRGALRDLGTLGAQLEPAARALRPAAAGLRPALDAVAPFAKATTPVVRDQLRPLAREAQPAVRTARPAARALASATPDLHSAGRVLEELFDTLAGDPAGEDPAPLHWLAWGGHLAASLVGTQDAHGPVRRGLLMTSCSSLAVLEQIGSVNPTLGTLVSLLDAPTQGEVCPDAAPTTAEPAR
ncbi:MlaD family protein [Conexibacter sp. SYSU D00693]|uniref:MlaD family protein n=1 Tax=Conexibacter sp. SYSU D00693 TaxID=2812560 RepID=UPI00196B079C|nr:MlaD family protein [Conexibacter sp. SYSU D00693]